jgi:hypothetical protein
MSLFESIRFLMDSLMDTIYERELYINRKLIYIE